MGHHCHHQCHHHRNKQKERGIVACIICSLITVILLIILAILYFSVFKPKDPRVQVPLMQIVSYNNTVGNPPSMSSVSLGLNLQVLIYNPNRGVFYIEGASTASLYYGAAHLGTTILPYNTPISSQSFTTFMVHVGMQSPILLNMSTIYTHPNTIIPVPLSTVITIYGHVTIAGVRSLHPIIVSACDVNVALANSHTYIQSYICKKSYPVND